MTFHACRADGTDLGEFSETDFRNKIFSGELQRRDFYWHEGMPNWKPISEYRVLAKTQRIEMAPPASAPPAARTAAAVESKLCANCGYVDAPVMRKKGSSTTEFLLWLCLLLPGLFYSIWRLGSRHAACPKCHAPDMIPTDSPVAQKFLADLR